MRPPGFWQADGVVPRLLSPLSALVARMTARRVARPGWTASVPVLCCGNAGVGGAGKTTVVLDLAERLQARGVAVHCLSRGYRGRVEGVLRVDPDRHDAKRVGDEPLLLAAVAPTWVGADRAAAARAAIGQGAQALLMDDGLQNRAWRRPHLCWSSTARSGSAMAELFPPGPCGSRSRPRRQGARPR